MKRFLIVAMLLIAILSQGFTQVPGAFNYQAVVRNISGEVISNQNVSFRISILENSTSGNVVYSETHKAQTNNFGLVNLKVGKGTRVSGNFNPAGWGSASHFIKVEFDATGGSNYTLLGTSELLSVPYAFHAQTVENDKVDDADADATNEIQTLNLSGTQLSLSKGGGTVTLPSSGGGDNWGTQTVVSDETLNGDGTTARPLGVVGDLTDDQTLSISGNNLSISGGNTVTLPTASPSPWTTNGDNISRTTGKVGIGTDTPAEKLDVKGNITVSDSYLLKNSGGSNFVIRGVGPNIEFVNYYPSYMAFYTTPVDNGEAYARMYISKTGNIGIGTINPQARLHLAGDGFPGSFMFLEAPSGQDAGFRLYEGLSAKWHIFNNASAGGLQIYNNAGKTAIFAKQSNSYVGIGTTNPTQALHVVGNAYKTEGGTSWATSSDIRLKNLLGNYEKGLAEISALQPVKYVYKKDNPRQLNSTEVQVGFVAQEVQKIFPEAVSEGEDGYLDFNIHPINVAFVNAIKELKTENDRLKSKVSNLESRLAELESLVKATASK